MPELASAVILDVDGVLLELTAAEEDTFFEAFHRRYRLEGLSRDWDSYRIRNDQDIIDEILATHGLPASGRDAVIADYLAILSARIANGSLKPVAMPGSVELLAALARHRLGIATANLLAAAEIRLKVHGLWEPVCQLAFGAEGGGAKRGTLARAIAATGLPKSRIVYVGDNLNDVDAGLANGVSFIGFSADPRQCEKLARAGAGHLATNHAETAALIASLLP